MSADSFSSVRRVHWWDLKEPPINAAQSADTAKQIGIAWTSHFHHRLEVALKIFVSDTIGITLSGRDPFRAAIRRARQKPELLRAILRGDPTAGSNDFTNHLIRAYLEHNAPPKKDNNPDLAWAVHAADWVDAEIRRLASEPMLRGRRSKGHLDNLMSAVVRIAASCHLSITLPGHDRVGASTHPLFCFAERTLYYGCEYGLRVAAIMPSETRATLQDTFRALKRSTHRSLIDSLERAKQGRTDR